MCSVLKPRPKVFKYFLKVRKVDKITPLRMLFHKLLVWLPNYCYPFPGYVTLQTVKSHYEYSNSTTIEIYPNINYEATVFPNVKSCQVIEYGMTILFTNVWREPVLTILYSSIKSSNCCAPYVISGTYFGIVIQSTTWCSLARLWRGEENPGLQKCKSGRDPLSETKTDSLILDEYKLISKKESK